MEFFHTSQFYHKPKLGTAQAVLLTDTSRPSEFVFGYVKAADEEDAIHVVLSRAPCDDDGERMPARSVVISRCADDYFHGRHYLKRWLSKPFVFNKKNVKIIKELSGGYVVA